MNAYFLIAALAMSLLAILILAGPLASTARSSNKGNVRLSLLVAVCAVILAIALYSVLGRPGIPSSNSNATNVEVDSDSPSNSAAKTDGIGSVDSLLAGLQERLEQDPSDAKGWLLLAKSYQHLGRDDEARAAYDKAAALGQTDLTFAESLAANSTPVAETSEIRGHVSLSESAMAQVKEGDTVFIFAKALNGPQMPLAVVRRPVTDLPFEFSLNDTQSMVDGSNLSSVDTVVVTAKISAHGNALATNPELETKSETVATVNAPYLELIIGRTQ
jgi:cytochrome c-type biogenesis protein CcmH